MDEHLKDYLQKHKIDYILHKHNAVFTVDESKNNLEIKNIPGVRTKSLFLKDEKNQYYLVCMPGEKRLNIKALKAQLNVKEIHFSSPAELRTELHLTPGSVSIFGMIHAKNTILIIDKSVWDAEVTGFHPNINTATLEVNHADLERFVNSLNQKKLILELK
jgi:Ala-tRNA(Pro) deacylase